MSKKDAILCLFAAGLLGGLAAVAQNDPEQQPEDTEESAEAPVTDDVFIPSEEVQAAEEITFPVNI